MSRTRRSISVSLELYRDLTAFCEAHAIPASQLATRAIRSVLDGVVPTPVAQSSIVLAVDTKISRGQMTRRPASEPRAFLSREELDARVADRDAARKAKAEVERVLAARIKPTAPAKVSVSTTTFEAIQDQIERACVESGTSPTPSAILDAALNRMLDAVESEAATGALCRTCCEAALCRCNGDRAAVGGAR